MGNRNPKVDLYISKSADFAKPILSHFRTIVHQACPTVEEEMKWSMPHFMYKGMLCGMAAFKNHCAVGFWKGSILFGEEQSRDAMGHFGKIGSLADLPSDKKLRGYVKEAMRLNEEGIKVHRAVKSKEKKNLKIPEYFRKALRKDRKASNIFEKFSPSQKKEYVEWLTEAKTDTTREKRLSTAMEWIAEGKSRHWKYKR